MNDNAIEAKLQAIEKARAQEALRVTAGYTTEELRAMPDSRLKWLEQVLNAFVVVTECAICNTTMMPCLCDGENYICADRYACRARAKARRE